ncbi:histidine--tRNA ligase [Candidatus Bandiella euplotis]|uniref:Histidine--tRNA ligase n=1 Tax=Candidatus Bandiella euplotis TaxID=1664265 RepID=A0ABZ0ULS7_9RICK|nr:histidine--tRNA ligase [Candidatus Bandiella woodruffii]WPX96679.1 Histidine--tRNA ligase [Candidatus Bandiella woodruffii]
MKLQRIRGTADLYGQDVELFRFITSLAQKFAVIYSFKEISTPIMEDSEVFHRTLGEMSDIVNKETYTFLDRDKSSITLRPEFTAAVVRAVISNGMLQSLPLRLFSYGPLFRHERPQKCRLRQFHQINFEYIGSSHLNVDVELIMLAHDILESLELSNSTTLIVNTLGTVECRNSYKTALREYLLKYKQDLSEISQQRLDTNPLRILDTKDEKEQDIIRGAPVLYDFIANDSKLRFEQILSHLNASSITFEHSNRLVRGLDYYSDFVFEFTTSNLGSQGTVIAGGRYDGLISQMGGLPTPAAGFAGGIERIMELLKYTDKKIAEKDLVYLVPIGEAAEDYSLKLSHELRKDGFNLQLDYSMALKKKMQRADKLGVKYCVIYGENELQNQNFILKDMQSGEEVVVNKFYLTQRLKNINQ